MSSKLASHPLHPSESKCAGCHILEYSPEKPDPRFPDIVIQVWLDSIVDIINAIYPECKYCTLLRTLIHEFIPAWKSKIEILRLYVLGILGRPLLVEFHYGPTHRERYKISVSASSDRTPGLFPYLGTQRSIPVLATTSFCVSFIRDCIETCQSHSRCSPQNDFTPPARLVDVGLDDGVVKLRNDLNRGTKYTALSYCWGKSASIFTLKTRNIRSLESSIPLPLLPATIQDAIAITHSLGIRYIWIDCLCILQDSQSDWEKEAAQMCDYYSNASITLAASWAPSASHGLLGRRHNVSRVKDIHTTDVDGTINLMLAQRRDTHDVAETVDDFGPISQRAWTLQEHVLSKRIAHFTRGEIIFECRTHMISEDGHQVGNEQESLLVDFAQEVSHHPDECWRNVLRWYSSRLLSYGKDRLPAIAGLAARYADATGSQYVAGLWRESLPNALVWSNATEFGPEKYPAILSGPSWSWASIQGAVCSQMTFHDHAENSVRTLACVHDVQCCVPGQNPFGEVESGMLDISGPALETILQGGEQHDGWRYRLGFRLADLPDANIILDTFVQEFDLTTSGAVQAGVRRASSPSSSIHAGVWCLWIFSAPRSKGARFDDDGPIDEVEIKDKLNGVLLARSFRDSDTFTRIGFVSMPAKGTLEMASGKRFKVV